MKLILAEGVESFLKRSALLAGATRAGVQAMGLTLFAKRPSHGVTAINAPSGVDTKRLVKHIQDRYHVTLAGGQGEMAGKVFRIAHMGYIGAFDLLVALATIELSLVELGVSVTPGQGLKAFQEVIGDLAAQTVPAAVGVR